MTAEQATQDTPDARRAALTRRHVLRGLGVGGLALPVLAACGSESEPTATPGGSDPSSGPTSAGSGGDNGDSDAGGGADGPTVAAADVPVGGGTILAEDMVVVTQPSEGEFKAFSARCTHQGCPVQTVADGRIGCNCHGSAFSVEDGSVITGPATSPLESLAVAVEGDQVVVG